MPDGTGEDYGMPSQSMLHQLSWDITYIRDKLVFGGVSKTMVWQRKDARHQLIVGKISLSESNFLAAFRNVADQIQDGVDGAAPPVESFGTWNWTAAQLSAMYDHLNLIAAKIMAERKSLVMRLGAMAGSPVEFTLGAASVANDSWRMGIKALALQL